MTIRDFKRELDRYDQDMPVVLYWVENPSRSHEVAGEGLIHCGPGEMTVRRCVMLGHGGLQLVVPVNVPSFYQQPIKPSAYQTDALVLSVEHIPDEPEKDSRL